MLKKIYIIIVAFVLCACQKIPDDALVLQQESLKMRTLQTRSFDTKDDMMLLSSSVQVLQDLGFDIDFTEKKLGIIVGSKVADATDNAEIAAKIALAVLAGTEASWNEKQSIKTSLFVTPINKKRMKMRVTFQRIVTNNRGHITIIEAIEDDAIYRDFFSKVSKAVFLEANQI